jgi:hypothetical protein
MRIANRASAHALVLLSLLAAGGCQSGSVGTLPAGPGVATHGDLTPWLATAVEAKQFGCLMEINVADQKGSYDTWALATPVPSQSFEVDVRGCLGAAQDFREKSVIVIGKLIPRDEHHLSLLVAQRIVPADENGNALPDPVRHVAMAPELDPVTGQLDPMLDFHVSPASGPVLATAN